MLTHDPLKARTWFSLRTPVNWVITLAVFIPLVFVLQNAFPSSIFVVDVSAIAGAFILFFFILDKRPINIYCPHCHKSIASDTPWICGFCKSENYNTDNFPFVGSCGNRNCRAKPKAYLCHHCGDKLIYFTNDHDPNGYARGLAFVRNRAVKREVPPPDPAVQKTKAIQLKELSVAEAKLDVELKNYDEILNPKKPKTHREILEQSASEYIDRNMSGEEIVRRLKEENAKKYKDDSNELKRQDALVDQWAQNNFKDF